MAEPHASKLLALQSVIAAQQPAAITDNNTEQSIHHSADPVIGAISNVLQARYGNALQALVLYGSYLRGKRDTLLDCYALLDDTATPALSRWHTILQRLLPPNVYYLSRNELGVAAHAKLATMYSSQLQHTICHQSHSYFWSRFAQPCVTIYARDADSAAMVTRLRAQAAARCLQEAAAVSHPDDAALQQWQKLFRHTYQAELRSETPERALELVDADAGYYQALSDAAPPIDGSANGSTANVAGRWRRRRWLGKTLSLLRLAKASLTFSDGLDYLLWKVERHSGVQLTATDRQRRYPLLFAWPLVWRAYRAGGFR